MDNSSRAVALALLFPLVGLLLRSPSPFVIAGMVGIGFITTALNPLVGLAATAGIAIAALITATTTFLRDRSTRFRASVGAVALPAAACFGASLAFPAYMTLISTSAGGPQFSTAFQMTNAALAIASISVVTFPLAVWSCFRAPAALLAPVAVLTIAGGVSYLGAVAVVLPQGNEHNLANVGHVLLAFPAVAWLASGDRSVRKTQLLCLLVFATFLPMTLASLASFVGRPTLPILVQGRQIQRLPVDGDLNSLYRWVRNETPPGAIFMLHPGRPIKMSGNVSEFPAFTGRSLFVDHPSYMTTPHDDFERRARIALDSLAGRSLSPADLDYLRALGRPVYLVHDQDNPVSRGSDPHGALNASYGPAVFSSGPFRVHLVSAPQE